MRIVIISSFYSEGMGYTENCLPKALASLGHDVHLVTSNLNVYGSSGIYGETYESFLGQAKVELGEFKTDSYTVHRLKAKMIGGYVYPHGLYSKIKELSPDIVHSIEIAALQTFIVAIMKPFFRFKLFTESHQHMSIVKPFLKNPKGNFFKILGYRLTRTFPTFLASTTVEKCYAIAPDCAYVANNHYGVPKHKIKLQGLGTDTSLFRPAVTDLDIESREKVRKQLGYAETDIVCIYTGRFSEDKNPLLLAKAIDSLSKTNSQFHGLFIGAGVQSSEIKMCSNVQILPFRKYAELSELYRLSDIAVWPAQESMSMLDAASCGLPLVVCDKIGEFERINGNGLVYQEGNMKDLITIIYSLMDKSKREKFGVVGREKMLHNYSWINIAKNIEKDYYSCKSISI